MVKRWILYVVALLGCGLFFAAYQGWLAWVFLLTVAMLPLFSLALSLPMMLLPKVEILNPGIVTAGEEAELRVLLRSSLPLPPYRCRLLVRQTLSAEGAVLMPGDPLPTGHCGQLRCSSRGFYLYDLLGMFRLRRNLPPQQVVIRPKMVEGKPLHDLQRRMARSWQPKYGGGFAENHELRLYRPGDGLNQIHWKLSAKTGNLIVREAMIPKMGRVLLSTDLAGTPEEMDRRMGRLWWTGSQMLELGASFELQALTGEGVRHYPVTNENELLRALDDLLGSEPAVSGSILDHPVAAAWQMYIGGGTDEA